MANEIEKEDIEEDTQKGKYLIFCIDNENYGIEIKHVTEIIGIQQITPIPELPCYIKGVINLRGKIIPVMDVRLRFKKQLREYDNRTCIVVIDIVDISIGLIVDRVSEVINISDEGIAPPPEFSNNINNRYIKAIGKTQNSINLILDCKKILTDEELENITGAV